MKRILFFVFISLFAVMAQAAEKTPDKRVFEGWNKLSGVEYTYVGPAALRLAYGAGKHIPGVPSGVKNITSVEVLECTNKANISKIRNFVIRYIKEHKFEVLVENREDNEENIIYGGMANSESTTAKDLIIVNSDEGEYTVVYIEGNINLAEMHLY